MEEKEFDDLFKAFGKYQQYVAQQFSTNIDAGEIQKTLTKYENAAVGFSKSMSMSRDKIVEIKASFADAQVSVVQLGGSLENIASIAESVGKSLNRNMILMGDSYSKLYATSKVTGEDVGALTKGFKDAGFSIYSIEENMKKAVDKAKESGINAQVVSSGVLSNLDKMDKYNFSNGVDGLAKMVTAATNLRINVEQIFRSMDKAFKPEGAIEMAAALQRLGVAQSDLLDPLRLMDMSRNDPVEFQKQIAEMSKEFVDFNEKTKQFEILPGAKERLMEVAGALGMDEKEFAKMAKSAAEMEDKMKKISFPDTFSDEQKTLIANMAEMGKGGEYMLRVEGKDKSIEEAVKLFKEQPEVYEKFLADSKPKSMEDLARDQLTTQQQSAAYLKSLAERTGAGLASSKMEETTRQAEVEIAKSVSKVFSGEKFQPKAFRETIDTASGKIQKGYESGNVLGGLAEAGDAIKTHFVGAADDFVKGVGTALTDLNNSTNPIIKVFGDGVKTVGNLFTQSEKLETSFSNINKTVDKKPVTAENTSTTANAVNNVLTNSSGTQTQTPSKSEIVFSAPLKMELTVNGLNTNTSEEDFLKMVKEGKLDQLLSESLSRAKLMEVKQETNK